LEPGRGFTTFGRLADFALEGCAGFSSLMRLSFRSSN
jgi:hypothetical protein